MDKPWVLLRYSCQTPSGTGFSYFIFFKKILQFLTTSDRLF